MGGAVARTAEAGICLAKGDTEGAKEAAINAGLNAGGDLLGLATGGAGKIAMKQGAKVALKAGAKAMSKKMTKAWWKSYAKKYLKKKIKEEGREQVRQAWERFQEEGFPDELGSVIDSLSNATGMTREEVNDMGRDDILMCAASIADLPDSDPYMDA